MMKIREYKKEDVLHQIQQILSEPRAYEAFLKMEAIRGEKGDTPQKYVDYFTPNEINEIVKYIQDNIKPGPKGDKGNDGAQGAQGERGESPVKGVHYWTKKDRESIIQEIIAALPKNEAPTIEEIVAVIPDKKMKFSDIEDAPDVKDLHSLINFLKSGGFRGGGDTVEAGTNVSITYVNGVKKISSTNSGWTVAVPTGTVNGINTTFTVASAPHTIITDTGVYVDGHGYTYAAGTITMVLAPNEFIRAYL